MVVLHETLIAWSGGISYKVMLSRDPGGLHITTTRFNTTDRETNEVTFQFPSSAYAFYSACVQVYTEMSLSQCLEIIRKEPTKLSDRTYI